RDRPSNPQVGSVPNLVHRSWSAPYGGDTAPWRPVAVAVGTGVLDESSLPGCHRVPTVDHGSSGTVPAACRHLSDTGAHIEAGGRDMAHPSRDNAMDHVVVVMFENRSFDNLLGRLYQPGEVESFEGVIGRGFSNPIRPATGASRPSRWLPPTTRRETLAERRRWTGS